MMYLKNADNIVEMEVIESDGKKYSSRSYSAKTN